MSKNRGMAHFPVMDALGHCWRCCNFLPASDPQRGRCVKFLEFTGQTYRLSKRGHDNNWWRGLPTIDRLALACKYYGDAAQSGEVYVPAEEEAVKLKRPNYAQARWLQRIAASPLMVTKSADEETLYSLQDGSPVPTSVAKLLIKNGWLRAQRDGLFDEPQTYRALTP